MSKILIYFGNLWCFSQPYLHLQNPLSPFWSDWVGTNPTVGWRRGTPWKGRPSVAGSHNRTNTETPIDPWSMILDCGRTLDFPEKTQDNRDPSWDINNNFLVVKRQLWPLDHRGVLWRLIMCTVFFMCPMCKSRIDMVWMRHHPDICAPLFCPLLGARSTLLMFFTKCQHEIIKQRAPRRKSINPNVVEFIVLTKYSALEVFQGLTKMVSFISERSWIQQTQRVVSGWVLASIRSQIMWAPPENWQFHIPRERLSSQCLWQRLFFCCCFLMAPEAGESLARSTARAPGRRRDGHRLNSTHETTDTALSPERRGARLQSYFYSCPISSTTSPIFTCSGLL